MVSTPKPNGFADHYPYEMAIIGNIPYFQTNPNSIQYIPHYLKSKIHHILLGVFSGGHHS